MDLKKDKKNLSIVVLVILLIAALSYMGLGKYQNYKQKEQLTTFQQGAQYGYQQAVIQVAQQAVTCQPVPLNIQNQTINMVAVECLQNR